MAKAQTIFFLGKPGCGKGTQAKLLSQATGWPVISAGGQLRTISAKDTLVGKKIKAEIDAGELVPHWFAMYLYLKALFDLGEGANVIFDGFNRKVPEAELVVESLRWLDRSITILNLTVSDEVVRERIAGRRSVEGRADDNAVGERLKEYYEHTEPSVEIFRDAGALIDVNGEQPPEAIAADIKAALHLS